MRTHLRRFTADRRGSIGLWMAVAILPITLMVGAATDLRRVETMRSAMQDASDAAILAGAKAYLATGESDPQRLEAARRAAGATLTGNVGFNPAMLADLKWDVANAADGGGELILNTSAKVPLAFGGLFGMSALPIKTTAASVVELRLEIALVLDTTGSMSGDRIARLKEATAGLIDQLDAAARQSSRTNPLKIALVPYSSTVRVSPASQSEDWLDSYSSGDKYWVTKPTTLVDRFNSYGPEGWAGCVETRPMPYDVQDTPASKSEPDTLFVPFFNTHPLSTDPNQNCFSSEVVRLTRDAARVKAAALAMPTDGFTNIPLGLAWGWHALTPDSGPFGAGNAEPYGKADLIKAVVLITDGDNDLGTDPNEYSGAGRMDQERVGVDGASSRTERQHALDGRLALLCENMKDKGVILYTVRVEEGSAALLETCASERKDGSRRFWNVTDASKLPAAFNKIGQELIEVRLSR